MASPVKAPPSQKWPSSSGSRDGMTVLNAASHMVLERTIVEAFVKLVVCRKVTVQQVAATSGQVLDSHTTQEEDSPVILEVHRHEVGGDCSTRRLYPRLASESDSLHSDPFCQTPSPSSTQHGTRSDHRCHKTSCLDKSNPLKDSVSGSCDPVQKKRQSSSQLQGKKETEGLACRPVKTGKHKKETAHKPVGLVGRKPDVPDQAQVTQADGQLHSSSLHGKRRHDGACSDGLVSYSKDKVREHSHPKEIKLVTDDSCENSKEDRGDEVKQYERLVTKICGGVSSTDEGRTEAAPTTTRRKDCTQESKEAVTEQDSAPSGEGEELTEDSSAEVTEEPGQEHDEFREEHNSDMTEVGNQDVEMTSGRNDTATGLKKESGSMQVTLKPHPIAAPSQTSCSQPSSDGIEDKSGLKHHDTDLASKNLEDENTGVDCAEVNNEPAEDKTGHENNSQQSSEPTEYDTEQDMLVIDISNSVLEQTPHAIDTEQVHPNTDSEQIQPDSDSGQKPSDADSESIQEEADNDSQTHQNTDTNLQTHQNTDSGTSTSAADQRQLNAQKPDPFFHLLTNFPVLDRPRSKESHSSGHGETNRERNRTSSDSSVLYSSKDIKEEVDDDCMITAAFISTTKESRGHQQRSAPHTVTSQSAAVHAGSIRTWRDGVVGSPRRRQNVERGQYQQSVLMQFQQPFQSYQINPPPVATAAAGTSALSFQSRASSSHSEPSVSLTTLPSTSQAYVPNFLATTPEVSECRDSGNVLSVPQEGNRPVDFSPTYQCPVCNKIFMHEHKFSRHIAMCGGRRPFKCKICGKAFNQRAHLDTHLKFHMGIKRYKCEVCRKAYVMKGDLIRHLKTRAHQVVLQSCGMPVQ